MKRRMRLPDALYNAVKPLFVSHARWHAARDPRREGLRGPGTEFPDVLGLNEAGSGEQFLSYHREMLRTFTGVAFRHPDTGFVYRPWPKLPNWLGDFFAWAQPGFLDGALTRARDIVRRGTADELGNFLESTLVTSDPFRGIHNIAHGNIAAYEEHRFGTDHPGLRDARMDSSVSSPHNEHFWGLHGWIDEMYVDLQRRRGEAMDRSEAVISELRGAPHESG